MIKGNYRIYANCFLVKGAKRSVLCDVQRSDYQIIPNSLYEILTEHKDKSIDEIKRIYSNQFDETINEYFDFLIQNEFAFLCEKEQLELFPDIDLDFDFPAYITNAIIDVNQESKHNFQLIFQQFEELGCKHFQLRSFDERPLIFYREILEELESRRILSTEFIVKNTAEITEQNLQDLIDKYPRVHNFIVHSATENRIARIGQSKTGNIVFVKQSLDNHSHCGNIGPDYFSINIQTFTESQKHNTCLNRKISITTSGDIKNCPSMAKSYGNIQEMTLKEAIEKEGFKDVWFINKDQIEVCKDCEFRHICTDCRAFINNPVNIYSKPAKCTYNPFSATWGEENLTNNPLYGI